MSDPLARIYPEQSQAIWLDHIARDTNTDGTLARLVEGGLRGVTSNPAIFESSIKAGGPYDAVVSAMAGAEPDNIAEAIMVEDIRSACDLLRPVYEESDAIDGYVSLEVSPTLAHDAAGTISQGRHLWEAVDKPNLMIKVPATPAGMEAIEALIGAGINVNVTLLFSRTMWGKVAEAHMAGLEHLASKGGDLSRVASVASFFISRIDAAVDKALGGNHPDLASKAAIANAKLCYRDWETLTGGARWQALAAKGAQVQRLLWASTSTKDPSLPDTLYIDSLIGPRTVNTVPPATLQAFRDHGTVARTIDEGLAEAQGVLDGLKSAGVDFDAITDDLLTDGLAKFETAYGGLIEAVSSRAAA